MPQASAETVAAMERLFGKEFNHDDSLPIGFLEAHRYSLSPKYEWSKDGINTYQDMSRDEFDCLLYLVHEWDFGGLAAPDA